MTSNNKVVILDGRFQPYAVANPLPITDATTGVKDAFGRGRVSDTDQRLDVEFIYNKQEEFFDEVTNGGSVTWSSTTRDLTLAISNTNTSTNASMSSYPVPYTPGNSQLVELTGVLNYANLSGSAEVFLRSNVTGSVVEETIAQADWLSLDSGVNWQYSHIFAMDFQSLKVGTVRYFLVQNGVPIQVAQINNDNKRNTGYWQLANLPAFWKIYNDGTNTIMECGYGNANNAIGFRYKVSANASATMKAICCTVKSEGGKNLKDMDGLPRSADSGTTAKTVSSTRVPLLSIRPRSTFGGVNNLSIAIPKSFNISTDNPILLEVYHDSSLTGASWANVDTTESCMEKDTSATAYSNGHKIYSEYITTNTKNAGSTGEGLLGKTVLWNRLGSESGIFTFVAVRTTTTNASVYTSVQWDEIR